MIIYQDKWNKYYKNKNDNKIREWEVKKSVGKVWSY